MRNSWKGYVCFSLSESLGLYKQTTWTCLCSFSFTFQGLLHRVYVSSVPRVIHKLLQHKELQPWPDENQHQFFFGDWLITNGSKSSDLVLPHPGQAFETVCNGETAVRSFPSLSPPEWTDILWIPLVASASTQMELELLNLTVHVWYITGVTYGQLHAAVA